MSSRTLLGILDDGGPRHPTVPTDARLALALQAGASERLTLWVVKATSERVLVHTGYTYRFVAKRSWAVADAPVALNVAGTVNADGSISFAIAESATRHLTPGAYAYVVTREKSSAPTARDFLVPLSELTLRAGM